MKFECSTKELKAALTVASKHVNPKSPLPILGHFLVAVDVESQSVSVTATDLDTGVTVTIDADVAESGSVTLPAKQLTAVVGLVSTKTLRVSRQGEGLMRVDTDDDGRTSQWDMQSLPAEEYPSLPGSEDLTPITLPAAALGNAIEEVSVAVAKSAEESRAVMTGIQITTADGVLTLVGTDCRRIAVAQRPIEFKGEITSTVIPLGALMSLAKALGSKGDVQVSIGRHMAFFQFGCAKWFARMLEGRFPDWTKVMPVRDTWPWVVRVNRAHLIDAVRGGLAMAKEEKSPALLVLNFSGEGIAINSSTANLGQAAMTLEAECEGGDFPPYGINGGYVLDALMAIETESVIWELQTDSTSSVLRPDDDISFRYVVMPVKLRDVMADLENARG